MALPTIRQLRKLAVNPRQLELRLLDMTVAVRVFQWAILEKSHRQKAVPPDMIDLHLDEGYQIPESFRSMGIDFYPRLPFYSSVQEDCDLIRKKLDPDGKWSFITSHTTPKKGKPIPMYVIGSPGGVRTEWPEKLPGICLHALAVQKVLDGKDS